MPQAIFITLVRLSVKKAIECSGKMTDVVIAESPRYGRVEGIIIPARIGLAKYPVAQR